jgi:hypothetical protein
MAGRTSHGTTQDQASFRFERNICTKHEILRNATSNSFKCALRFISWAECELLWHSGSHRTAANRINAAKEMWMLRTLILPNSKTVKNQDKKVKLCVSLIN